MNNQTNTAKGTNVEHLFANSILGHPNAFGKMQLSLNIPATAVVKEASVIGGRKRKTDVSIAYMGSTIPDIRVSVKSFQTAGYNHVERRGFAAFCERNQISKSDTYFLGKLWLRKAANSTTQILVEPAERAQVSRIFSSIEPSTSALLGNDHPQFLAIYSSVESKWYIYNMVEQVLPLLRGSVTFTRRSANIAIGKYIVIQRKGSASGEAGKDPMSLTHGSNNFQIKMKVKLFCKDVTPICSYTI